MIEIAYEGKNLSINSQVFSLSYEIREAFVLEEKIIVLIDPNAYLTDPDYPKDRRRGNNAFRNLIALSKDGKTLLWEAEFPDKADYYYKIVSKKPLIVNSFSSYRCEIDINTGRIIKKEFYK